MALSPLLAELHTASRHPGMAEICPRLGLAGIALPLWGIAAVETGDGGRYQPEPSGRWAAITGAFDEDGRLIDLVATSLATRAVRRACRSGRPLHVFTDGLSWLRHGGEGVVILDWSLAPFLLADAPAIACQSERLARRLQCAFERPLDHPPLFVPPPQESQHA